MFTSRVPARPLLPLWISAVVIVSVLVIARAAYARSGRPASTPAKPPQTDDVDARIDAFWTWWRGASPRLAAAIDAKKAVSITAEVGAHVDAIDSRLAWETGPGLHGARHHFSLSSEGDIDLRVLTERWVARAPRSDGTWEYYPARQAYPRDYWALELHDAAGTKIDFSAVKVGFETNVDRELINVRFHHPALAKLDDNERARAAFLTLDNVLGEDGVERWVGAITPSVDPIVDGRPLDALRQEVEKLKKIATGERFAILKGKTADGQPMIATVNLALKRLDHLLMEEHLTVTFPLSSPTPQGLTTPEEADVLNKVEDELLAALGHDAVYIGRETGQRQRVLHFHVASAGPAEARSRAWAKQHKERRAVVTIAHDPRWQVLRRW